MVLSQGEPLFSLCNAAQVDSIFVVLETRFGLIQELDRQFNVSVLTRGKNCQNGVLDWVQLMG